VQSRRRRHSSRRQSPFPPRAAQDPLAAAAIAAHPRPDATIRAGRPLERRRSTGRQERQARPDRRRCWDICLCPREARRSRNGPPSRPAARARPPPALSRSRPGARRGLGGCAASPLAAAAGPAPGAERLAATRPHLKPRHRLDPPQHAAALPDTLTEPRHQNRSNPHRRPQPATPARRSYYLSPALAPAASPRVTSTVHSSTLQTHPQPNRSAFPAPVAAAPPQALPASRLGWPIQVYLAGRGRGVRREAADPPSSRSPRGKPRETPEGGAAACCAQGRNP
jgi:hypothetical protein